MRIDQWTKFVDAIANDREAKAIFCSGDAKKIAGLAQSKGFSFTEQDVADARVHDGNSELSGSALEGVAGGSILPYGSVTNG